MIFVGKLDRTDEFLLLTPAGALKTRCVRRLEGDNAWDLQFLNVCVGSLWNATARSTQQKPTIQQKDEFESGRLATGVYLRQNVLDKYGRTAGCPGCVGNGQHIKEYRARIEQEMVDKGDAIKLETGSLFTQICCWAGSPCHAIRLSCSSRVENRLGHSGGAHDLHWEHL